MVTYNFTPEDGFYDDSNMCSVTYVWARTPSISQFLSLLFNFPVNNLTDITLTLPHQCRGLMSTASSSCSCLDEGSILDILTQQVNFRLRLLVYV